jgi:type II secretory pathway pseudopilin PulG
MKAKSIIISVVAVVVVIGLGLGGYFYAQDQKDQAVKEAEANSKTEANAAAKKAVADALAKENANNKVTDSNRPTNEKTPPKVVTDPTCNTDELSLKTAASDGGGAGTTNFAIVLTNTGARTCDLYGFPGVSLVNANGNQIGKPADRATNYKEEKFTLKTGNSVKAVISVSNQGNFDSGTCKDGATKLRVYPPNDAGYLSVATTQTAWCPGFMTSPVLAN